MIVTGEEYELVCKFFVCLRSLVTFRSGERHCHWSTGRESAASSGVKLKRRNWQTASNETKGQRLSIFVFWASIRVVDLDKRKEICQGKERGNEGITGNIKPPVGPPRRLLLADSPLEQKARWKKDGVSREKGLVSGCIPSGVRMWSGLISCRPDFWHPSIERMVRMKHLSCKPQWMNAAYHDPSECGSQPIDQQSVRMANTLCIIAFFAGVAVDGIVWIGVLPSEKAKQLNGLARMKRTKWEEQNTSFILCSGQKVRRRRSMRRTRHGASASKTDDRLRLDCSQSKPRVKSAGSNQKSASRQWARHRDPSPTIDSVHLNLEHWAKCPPIQVHPQPLYSNVYWASTQLTLNVVALNR